MFGFQTISCLHDIPVVRSSTNLIQNVYTKAKDTSVLIRLPCTVAETIADKSLQVAVTVASPFVKPLSQPVRAIDGYAARKLREIERKYPVIVSRPDDVLDNLNEKTKPVREAVNIVKDTATATIQQGKDTVSNVATATATRATGVADSVLSYYGTCARGKLAAPRDRVQQSIEFAVSTIGGLYSFACQSAHLNLTWLRMLLIYNLLRVKDLNDMFIQLSKTVPMMSGLPQQLLVLFGATLEAIAERIRPDDRTLAELQKTKEKPRSSEKSRWSGKMPTFFAQRPPLEVDPSVSSRPDVIGTDQHMFSSRTSEPRAPTRFEPDYSNMTDTEELHARLAAQSIRISTNGVHTDTLYTDDGISDDIADLHKRVKPTDIELLHARVGDEVVVTDDNGEPLTQDQQELIARVMAQDSD